MSDRKELFDIPTFMAGQEFQEILKGFRPGQFSEYIPGDVTIGKLVALLAKALALDIAHVDPNISDDDVRNSVHEYCGDIYYELADLVSDLKGV